MERVANSLVQDLSVDSGYGDPPAPRSTFSRDPSVSMEQLLEQELTAFEEYLAEQLDSRHDAVSRVMRSAAACHGKRLRPRLVLLSSLACGGLSVHTRRVAAVVEMVHAATLVHDDVLDSADTRRGAPTSHVNWGNHASILLGDILFSKAFILAAGAGSCAVADRVGRAGLALCEGELRQQDTIGRWDLAIEEYFDILRQKTGDLCAASSGLGAWSAEACRNWVDALEAYGMKLGIAFQIYDDWLDVWGTPAIGKPLGNDVANRKPTLPSLRLIEQTPAGLRGDMIAMLDRGIMDDRLRDAFDRSDASAVTLDAARGYAEAACDALSLLPDSAAKQALICVAHQSIRRVR